jgi:hypothetical protein
MSASKALNTNPLAIRVGLDAFEDGAIHWPPRAEGMARSFAPAMPSDQAQDQAAAERAIVTYQQPPARFSAPIARKKAAHP